MSLVMYTGSVFESMKVTGTDRGLRDAQTILALMRGELPADIKSKHRYYNLAKPEEAEAHDMFIHELRLPYPDVTSQEANNDWPVTLEVGPLGHIQRQISVHKYGVGVCYFAERDGVVTTFV
jgi:hypothetical protein